MGFNSGTFTRWLFVHCVQIELELKMLVFEERGKQEYPEKNLGARTRTNNKLTPHLTPSPGLEPGPHWWVASALTTALTTAKIKALSFPVMAQSFLFKIRPQLFKRWIALSTG